jgi:hypothetical protein
MDIFEEITLEQQDLDKSESIDILKGKSVPVGTVRKRPNGMFVKTNNGWKYQSSHKTHEAKEDAETRSKVKPMSGHLKTAVETGHSVNKNSGRGQSWTNYDHDSGHRVQVTKMDDKYHVSSGTVGTKEGLSPRTEGVSKVEADKMASQLMSDHDKRGKIRDLLDKEKKSKWDKVPTGRGSEEFEAKRPLRYKVAAKKAAAKKELKSTPATFKEVLDDRSPGGSREMMDSIEEYQGDLRDNPGHKDHMEGLRSKVSELEKKTGYKHDISEQEEAHKEASGGPDKKLKALYQTAQTRAIGSRIQSDAAYGVIAAAQRKLEEDASKNRTGYTGKVTTIGQAAAILGLGTEKSETMDLLKGYAYRAPIGESNEYPEDIEWLNKSEEIDIIKGKSLPIGTIKKRPNGMFIKTNTGWKYHASHAKHAASGGGEEKHPTHPISTGSFLHKNAKAKVDAAISKVGEALAKFKTDKDNYSPDTVTALRVEAKRLGAEAGMGNQAMNVAISTSRKAWEAEAESMPDIPDVVGVITGGRTPADDERNAKKEKQAKQLKSNKDQLKKKLAEQKDIISRLKDKGYSKSHRVHSDVKRMFSDFKEISNHAIKKYGKKYDMNFGTEMDYKYLEFSGSIGMNKYDLKEAFPKEYDDSSAGLASSKLNNFAAGKAGDLLNKILRNSNKGSSGYGHSGSYVYHTVANGSSGSYARYNSDSIQKSDDAYAILKGNA